MNVDTGEIKAEADLTPEEKKVFKPVPKNMQNQITINAKKPPNLNSPQLKLMADLIESKEKVVHHGGANCSIGGRQFPSAHLKIAQWMVRMRRAERRKQAEAQPST